MKQDVSRRLQLGPEELAKLREKLENAKAKNDTPIPEELFGTSMANVSAIPWLPVQMVLEGRQLLPFSSSVTEDAKLKEYIASDGQELPFLVQFDNIQVSGMLLMGQFYEINQSFSPSSSPSMLGFPSRTSQKIFFRMFPYYHFSVESLTV